MGTAFFLICMKRKFPKQSYVKKRRLWYTETRAENLLSNKVKCGIQYVTGNPLCKAISVSAIEAYQFVIISRLNFSKCFAFFHSRQEFFFIWSIEAEKNQLFFLSRKSILIQVINNYWTLTETRYWFLILRLDCPDSCVNLTNMNIDGFKWKIRLTQ